MIQQFKFDLTTACPLILTSLNILKFTVQGNDQNCWTWQIYWRDEWYYFELLELFEISGSLACLKPYMMTGRSSGNFRLHFRENILGFFQRKPKLISVISVLRTRIINFEPSSSSSLHPHHFKRLRCVLRCQDLMM